jgi:hypothetical protein
MTIQEHAAVKALTHLGITIAEKPLRGWGWSIANDKIVRDWSGTYATPVEAGVAAMEWLLEFARKGMLCHHTHVEPVDDDPMSPWLRAFEEGIPAAQ